MFKLLGVLVGLYTVAAAVRGEVFAKSGVWGRTIVRQQSPQSFWVVIAIYAIVSVALLTIF